MDFTALTRELGIDKMSPEQQQRIFEHAFKTLQSRMTVRLSEKLTSEQMQELADASERSDKEGQDVLNRLCPDYDKMYQEEIDKLKEDILAI
jgi:TRAP-type mannitol/chloroaromatic compound transport system substrate-binding protein